MTSMPGGLTATKPITEEVKQIAITCRPDIEAKAGRQFMSFTPTEFATQVVAGTNFFIKIDVGDGWIVARIWRNIQQNFSVNSIKTISASDPITYF